MIDTDSRAALLAVIDQHRASAAVDLEGCRRPDYHAPGGPS
ncbi:MULTISPECIES: hypothetical protein [unclassified Rathayibacter]|nr:MULTISPECIES: hypothetical protein [unclassified Rathayibacter]